METFYNLNGALRDDEVDDDGEEIAFDATHVETFYDGKGVDEFDEDEDSEILRDARKVETLYDEEGGEGEDYDDNDPIVEGHTNVDTFYFIRLVEGLHRGVRRRWKRCSRADGDVEPECGE